MKEYETTGELLADLGSDQTSLHNPFGGGYYPVDLSYEEAQGVMAKEPERFKKCVQERYVLVCVCVCVCVWVCVCVCVCVCVWCVCGVCGVCVYVCDVCDVVCSI